MKYLLFTGEDYYPRGGFFDFRKAYGTKEEAIEAFKNRTYIVEDDDSMYYNRDEWGHVVNSETFEIVWDSNVKF